MKKFLIVLVLIPFCSFGAVALTGSISYLEGTVDVNHDGVYLDRSAVDMGLLIEESDLIETGPDGFVEIRLHGSGASVIKVRESTSFYFTENREGRSRKRTIIHMLRGSLGFKLSRLFQRGTYQVRTDSALLAVRGTEFDVDMTPDRAVLITVPEGEVACTSNRHTVTARPDVAVVAVKGKKLNSVPVTPEELEGFRSHWKQLRLDALRIDAGLSVLFYAELWDELSPRFQDAMKELEKHRDVIDKWILVMRDQGALPSLGDIFKDKQVLSQGMIFLRSSFPATERTYYTLLELESYAGYGQELFKSKKYRNVKVFYRKFIKDKRKMRELLPWGRYLIRVFQFFETQTTPGGVDIFGDDPFKF